LFVFYGIDGIQINNGEGDPGCFWISGTVVYGVVVIVANFYIVQRTFTHTSYSTFLISFSIISWFVTLYLENLFPFFNQVYRIFGHMMSDPKVYLIFFLSAWFNYAQDIMTSQYQDWKHRKS